MSRLTRMAAPLQVKRIHTGSQFIQAVRIMTIRITAPHTMWRRQIVIAILGSVVIALGSGVAVMGSGVMGSGVIHYKVEMAAVLKTAELETATATGK